MKRSLRKGLLLVPLDSSVTSRSGKAATVSTSQNTSRIPPLVSIVTPSLNMAEYIEETVASVLTQDYPSIEYIVMDAGSTDDTLSILKKYEGRFQYTSQPDDGTADAINKGFELSRGSILASVTWSRNWPPPALWPAWPALIPRWVRLTRRRLSSRALPPPQFHQPSALMP